jgi:signal transduction histidine kinase
MIEFHADTFRPPRTLSIAFWVGVTAVIVLAGEAALQATWWWLTLAAVGAAVLVRFAPNEAGWRSLLLRAGLAVLAATSAVAAVRMGHLVYHAHALQHEAVDGATRQRDDVLRSAIASGTRVASEAVNRADRALPGHPPRLGDLLGRTGLETAVAVISGDTVIAAAGPHRMQPIMRPKPAALVTTPFAHMLVLRSTLGHLQGQAILLLDSLPGLPVAGPSLAARVRGWGTQWNWGGLPDGAVEYPDVAAAFAGVVARMQPVPPARSAFVTREVPIARKLVSAGLGLLALIILVASPHPVTRAGALVIPLWAVARSGVGTTAFTSSMIRGILLAVALLLVATTLWRLRPRRTPTGVVAAGLLLLATLPLLSLAVRGVAADGQSLSLWSGFAWQAVVSLGVTGLLAIATAGLRGAADQSASVRWGALAVVATLVVGLIGIVAWDPAGWPPWYVVLWVIPMLLLLPATPARVRLVTAATIGGTLAALATWSTSLDQRMTLATADLSRLDAAADTAAASALDQLAVAARAAHATRVDRLFAVWEASPLAQRGVPTYLALWSASGVQREIVALDSLSVGWNELAPLVAAAGTSATRVGLRRGVGHHEVLIVPLAPDTVATVTVGPRSRLLSPTTFGLLVGWRAPSNNPPYQIDLSPNPAAPADGVFRRVHRFVLANRIVTAGDIPREVRAVIEMPTPQPFLVRASLCVLLDVLLAVAVWLLLVRVIGSPPDTAVSMFRRSYRRTVAATLTAFFVVPAALFTAASVVRLHQESQQSHAAELTGAIRDVAIDGGLSVAATAAPSDDSLAFVGDSANAAVGVYRHDRLIAASDPMLAELGLLPPVIDRTASGTNAADPYAMPAPFPSAPLRLGAIDVPPPGTVLLTEIPGGDRGLAREQIDQALRLLLAVLAGVVASVLVAGLIARALGRPIDTLRRTALAIGRQESPPAATDVPAEFVPVFGAIRQMEDDLRETEAELRAGRARTAAILSTVTTGVIGVDAHGDVMHVNPRAIALLDHPLRVGVPLGEQLPDAWQRPIAEMQGALRRAPHPPATRELEIGRQRYAATLAALGDGGLVLAITDVTESSRAARIVAWGEMARQVAHEIKNPLTPMRLGLQHLRRVRAAKGPEDPALVDQTVERLLVEIERLDGIARSFARYGALPEAAAPVEVVAIRPVVDEVAALFALTDERPVLTIVGDPTQTAPARRQELVQVVVNLLDNAREAGASEVRLELGDHVLRVIDNGRGIPPDQFGRIFEPSFSTTTSGTGLGLAIVRRLVEGWGGSVTVDSGPGSGATFTVRFAADHPSVASE